VQCKYIKVSMLDTIGDLVGKVEKIARWIESVVTCGCDHVVRVRRGSEI
jgi:hypothetical protein